MVLRRERQSCDTEGGWPHAWVKAGNRIAQPLVWTPQKERALELPSDGRLRSKVAADALVAVLSTIDHAEALQAVSNHLIDRPFRRPSSRLIGKFATRTLPLNSLQHPHASKVHQVAADYGDRYDDRESGPQDVVNEPGACRNPASGGYRSAISPKQTFASPISIEPMNENHRSASAPRRASRGSTLQIASGRRTVCCHRWCTSCSHPGRLIWR